MVGPCTYEMSEEKVLTDQIARIKAEIKPVTESLVDSCSVTQDLPVLYTICYIVYATYYVLYCILYTGSACTGCIDLSFRKSEQEVVSF